MWHMSVSPVELVVRSVIIYIAFLACLRLFGKREVGQFTFFDLALVLLAANAVQPAMTGPDSSVPGGIVIIATIFGLNRIVAELRENVPLARRLLETHPTVIGRDGRWLPIALKREGLDITDGEAALREHGIDKIEEAKVVVLEPDGSISVVPIEPDGESGGRRRVRHRYRHPR